MPGDVGGDADIDGAGPIWVSPSQDICLLMWVYPALDDLPDSKEKSLPNVSRGGIHSPTQGSRKQLEIPHERLIGNHHHFPANCDFVSGQVLVK